MLESSESKVKEHMKLREEFLGVFSSQLSQYKTISSIFEEKDQIQHKNVAILNQIRSLSERKDVLLGSLQRERALQEEYIENSSFSVFKSTVY